MVLVIQILLGVFTLVVLIGAYLASKYWHWAHVLVLVAFYFASVGYAVLAARSLSTRLEYQEKVANAEKNLEQQETLNDALQRGTNDPVIANQLAARDALASKDGSMEGVVQLEHRLRMISRTRGRVWRFAQPMGIDPQTAVVTVGFPVPRSAAPASEEDGFADETAEEAPAGPPPALGLEADAIVYVFEQGPMLGSAEQQIPPRQYIGEFRVQAVDGRTAMLEPLDQLGLDGHASKRLNDSRGPWIVYESMPADSRDLFAGMDEETLKALLPASVVQEYLRDGTPSQPDDPPGRLQAVDKDGIAVSPDDPDREAVSSRYQRRLRDYAALLNDLEAERAELKSRINAIEWDLRRLSAALDGAKQIQEYREAEIAKWRDDLAAVERDRGVIESHAQLLQDQIANARRLLDETLQQNAQLAQVRAERRGALVPVGPGALDIDAL